MLYVHIWIQTWVWIYNIDIFMYVQCMSLFVFDVEVPKYLHGIMIGVPPWYQGLAADRSLPRAPPDHRLKQLNNNRLGIWHRAVAVLRYPKNMAMDQYLLIPHTFTSYFGVH